MDDRERAQTLGLGEAIAIGLTITGLPVLSSLAVERWGAIASVLILAAVVAALLGLVATGWLRRKGEGTWWVLALPFTLTTSALMEALGVPFWGSWLLVILIVLAVWDFVFWRLPEWQSRQGNSHR